MIPIYPLKLEYGCILNKFPAVAVYNYVRRMVPRVKDINPLGTQKTVSLDFDEEYAREGRQRNFRISQMITV